MEPKLTRNETEPSDGCLGFVMIKGDLGREITANDPSLVPNDPKSEEKAGRWLATSLKEYAASACGVNVEVTQTKIIKGLSRDQLVELYGADHGKWLDSLSKDDFTKQMEVYDGTMAPIIIATVKVDTAKDAAEAEVALKKVRDTLKEQCLLKTETQRKRIKKSS